ncbi:hypothetical protein H4K36_01460 [Streptomyces sp. DHE7-1]|nr:hypothetical protein [Streptomyces sp. DHE7-1]
MAGHTPHAADGASTGWTLAAVAAMASVPGAVMLLNKAVSGAFTTRSTATNRPCSPSSAMTSSTERTRGTRWHSC